ncbi:MAG TPA: asparaginase [Sulfurovum sp.]|nr:asparaginase [Sulfurovum sp.]
MKKILIINTGGTFNKTYNPLNGKLEINTYTNALDKIASKWFYDFEVLHIIGKDSLEMTNQDRLELLGTISQSSYHSFIVIHGTDTMDISAAYIDEAGLEKEILFTGAMVPYSIDPVEATANFASAYGYMQALKKDGVYIAMNGIIDKYHKIKKDRKKGKFIL